MSFARKCIKLGIIMLTQDQKEKYHFSVYVEFDDKERHEN